jgi:hypothetical protein
MNGWGTLQSIAVATTGNRDKETGAKVRVFKKPRRLSDVILYPFKRSQIMSRFTCLKLLFNTDSTDLLVLQRQF